MTLKGFERLALFSRVLCTRGRHFITGFACALPARDAEQVDGAEDLSAGGDAKEVRRLAECASFVRDN